MIALDLPPAHDNSSLSIQVPVQDPDKILKSKAIFHLQSPKSFIKPNKELASRVFRLIRKVYDDSLNLDVVFSEPQLALLVRSFIKLTAAFHSVAPDHFGVEYTRDNSVFFYVKRNDIDVQSEMFLDFSKNSVYVVNNIFESDELILNYSSDDIGKTVEKILGLLPVSNSSHADMEYFI